MTILNNVNLPFRCSLQVMFPALLPPEQPIRMAQDSNILSPSPPQDAA